MRRDQDQQVIGNLFSFQRRDDFALRIHPFGIEKHRGMDMTFFQQRLHRLCHALYRENARQRKEILDLGPGTQTLLCQPLLQQKCKLQRRWWAAIRDTTDSYHYSSACEGLQSVPQM